ncbi:MAG: transposase [Candidatus Aminicenantes bacterium]|nr:transposase [Candidatus Aminicenantes bacterium]
MMKLKRRGVSLVGMLISDVQQGIQAAVKKKWFRETWRKYNVHFMLKTSWLRSVIAIRLIWRSSRNSSGFSRREVVVRSCKEEYEGKYGDAIHCLEEELEDSLQLYFSPKIDKHRISSTNVLERTNREIRWMRRMNGEFPSIES